VFATSSLQEKKTLEVQAAQRHTADMSLQRWFVNLLAAFFLQIHD